MLSQVAHTHTIYPYGSQSAQLDENKCVAMTAVAARNCGRIKTSFCYIVKMEKTGEQSPPQKA